VLLSARSWELLQVRLLAVHPVMWVPVQLSVQAAV
jgi:hypothetical protein